MRALLFATAATLVALPAFAANLITFAQTSSTNEITATPNAGDTATTITASGAGVSIGQLISGPPPSPAFFSMTATSTDSVTTLGSAVIQHYSGNFCVTTAAGCGGTNVLSGTFTDAAFGGLGGPGLVVNVNNPPDTLDLTSSVIPAGDLVPPNAFGITFTNLMPDLALIGSTIAGFTATFAGDASANVAVPEPAGFALLGLGVLGIAAMSRRRAS